MTQSQRLLIAFCLSSVLSVSAWCTAFAAAPLQGLAVYPPDVRLATARDRQSFVVQATYATGVTRDVTAEATIALSNPALAKLAGNVRTPAAAGRGEMTITFDRQTAKLPVLRIDA